MGRADLIGNGKKHLIPAWQPIQKKKTVKGQPLKVAPRRRKTTRR